MVEIRFEIKFGFQFCPTLSVVWVLVPVVVGVESGGAMEIKLGLMCLIRGFNG